MKPRGEGRTGIGQRPGDRVEMPVLGPVAKVIVGLFKSFPREVWEWIRGQRG